MQLNPKILREYDIRGVVDRDLSTAEALAIGKAFGTEVRTGGGTTIAVGYDGRVSSPGFESELVEGLVSTGVTVLRVGRGPSPLLYFANSHLKTDGAIMVTGSHNPADYNGFKMILRGHSFYGDQIKALGRRIEGEDFVTGVGEVQERPILKDYVAFLLKDFETHYGKAGSLKVAWDPGNGAGADVLPALLGDLPGEHILINGEVDGTFPNHHPDPTVAKNLEQLRAVVLEEKCDLGLAFDGDADRLGVVDNAGNFLWGDQFMILLAQEVLASTPGATIIADVKASQTFFDQVKTMGGNPCMWRTGHSLIKTKMRETGAPLAGEMSGHIFFGDRYFGYDDGIYAGLRFLGICAQMEGPLSRWYEALPLVFNTPELRIPCENQDKFQAVERIKEALTLESATFSDIDGIRVMRDEGWWLLRASNTQEVLVARAEASSEAALEKLKQELEQYLSTLNLGLNVA